MVRGVTGTSDWLFWKGQSALNDSRNSSSSNTVLEQVEMVNIGWVESATQANDSTEKTVIQIAAFLPVTSFFVGRLPCYQYSNHLVVRTSLAVDVLRTQSGASKDNGLTEDSLDLFVLRI